MARSIKLRRWQKAALEAFRSRPGPDFLAVATPGAGKTTFALAAARQHLAEHPRRRLAVVAPTQHLKVQWADAAEALDLHLDPAWSAAAGRLPADVHGLVTTYQQVAGSARALAGLARDAFVVLDEVHHAGEERAWGDGSRAAFAGAAARLCLSGTPFRSDTRAIPFVRYDADGLAQADLEYGYGEALADRGVVRPVHFPRTDGEMEWVGRDGGVGRATFADRLDAAGASARLRTALSVEGEWLPEVLERAHARLTEVRRAHPGAGGMVIAIDQEHARGIAALLRRRLGVRPALAVSEDAAASARIAAFARGTEPWIVAVRMLSEGVDIPRLRVGVYAIAEQRRHSLRREDGPEQGDEEPEPIPFEDAGADAQLSLFAAISAVPTGHVAPGAPEEPAAGAGAWAEDDGEDLVLELAPAPLLAAPPPVGGAGDGPPARPRERRQRLRDANAALVRQISRITGLSHAQVNAELNRRVGVERVGEATLDQLERRREQAARWLAAA